MPICSFSTINSTCQQANTEHEQHGILPEGLGRREVDDLAEAAAGLDLSVEAGHVLPCYPGEENHHQREQPYRHPARARP